VEHEKSIFVDQAKESGKAENIIDKIVEGRMDKFYAESCLLEQSFIKDPDKKVEDLLTQAVSKLGENIIISRFTRFAIGEESSNGQPH
jgi:elongation factor Ts